MNETEELLSIFVSIVNKVKAKGIAPSSF